jgi:hypothetical protein
MAEILNVRDMHMAENDDVQKVSFCSLRVYVFVVNEYYIPDPGGLFECIHDQHG